MTSFRSVSHDASGSPATANSQRQWRFGYGGGGSSSIHPLAYLLENGGSIFDGTLSTFYTAQDKATPCATPDVDPVGCIVVPNGADFFQDSSPSKPVYVVNNGIPGFRAGDISGVDRHMKTPVIYGRTASPAGFTVATVRKYVSGTNMRHAGPPTTEPNHVVLFADSTNLYWYDTGNMPQLASATTLTVALEIYTVIPTGDDAGVYLYRYSLDGLVNDASGKLVSMNLNERPVDLGTSDWCFGGNLFNTAAAVQEIYFDLVANQPATAADVANIRSYAMSAFGALA